MQEVIDKILYDPVISKLVTIFIGIAIIWGVIKIISRSLFTKIKNNQARYRTRKFISFIGYLLVVVLITTVYSEKLGGLTVALGVAGAGIAFALQEVITSVAGWMAIIFGNFYKTGDRVQLGGIKGDVIDIGVLRTTIMETGEWVNGDLYNGRIVLVANSFVFKEPVFNYSGDFSFLWDEIVIHVQYGSDINRVKEILLHAALEIVTEFKNDAQQEWSEMTRKYMIEKARTEPMVSMTADESGLHFTLRYTVDFKQRRGTKDKLFTKIISDISATNGAIKLPQSTLEITKFPGKQED